MQTNPAKSVPFNAEIQLESSCIPPVSAVQCGAQIGSLWDRNYGRRGLGLMAETFTWFGVEYFGTLVSTPSCPRRGIRRTPRT